MGGYPGINFVVLSHAPTTSLLKWMILAFRLGWKPALRSQQVMYVGSCLGEHLSSVQSSSLVDKILSLSVLPMNTPSISSRHALPSRNIQFEGEKNALHDLFFLGPANCCSVSSPSPWCCSKTFGWLTNTNPTQSLHWGPSSWWAAPVLQLKHWSSAQISSPLPAVQPRCFN